MGKEILVNVANRETRIAVLDDNQLVELRIEREEQVVGNIYKGRVENVLPGMDAAFVDVGLERNAFLYVADILPEYVDSDDEDEEESADEDVAGTLDFSGSAIGAAAEPQAAAPAPPLPQAADESQRGGSSPKSRSRRNRTRRDGVGAETAPPMAAQTPAAPSATEDYRQYLSDPDRGQDDDSGGAESEGADHSAEFLVEIGTEDGFDLGDIEEADFDAERGGQRSEVIGSGELATGEPGDDDEIEPGAVDLARETEELLDEATPPNGDAGPVASTSSAAEVGEAESLVRDAAMIDAFSTDAQSEDTAVVARPVRTKAEVVRAPRAATRPGGRRSGAKTGSSDSGSGEQQIGQAKRPMRRGASGSSGGGRSGGRGFSRRHASIADLVHTKQELLLQVVKGPRGTKGSRVSTRMSLPGRYLVLMPDANNLGVSRKIEESKERDRLKHVVERFRQPGYGIIVRTEAEGRSASDLYQDYSMLVETWQNVWAKAKTTPAPSLIHQDQSLIYTIMRDVFGSDIDRLIIDSADDYARACDIIDRISPDLTDRIHLYDGEKPLFEAYRVEQDIERLLRRKVWLRSGGYLVIDQTEALTSIDVNTGKFVGSSGHGLSDTILQTNMEATGEIARQLRLRDLGGMIVLDFIDMDNQRDKKSVTEALFKALKDDRSRTKIASISPLGLIEMTRKRTKETVDVALTDTCPYCHGIGRVPSAETVSMQVEREIAKIAAEVSSEAVAVTAHPDVVAHLVGEQGQSIDLLERQVRRAIYVRADSDYHIEKYEVEPGSPAKIEQSYPLPRRGQVVEAIVQKSVLSDLPWASAFTPDGYQVEIGNGAKAVGQNAKIRLLNVARSYAVGELLGGAGGGNHNPNSGSVGRQGLGQGRPSNNPAGQQQQPQQERGGSGGRRGG